MPSRRASDDGFALRFAAATYVALWPLLRWTGRLEHPAHNAAMGAVCGATLALLTWRSVAPDSYKALRTPTLAAYQLGSLAVFSMAGFQLQMGSPPKPGVLGLLGDTLRVLTGCRCHMLLFLGAGLPLSLLPQMAVQSASLLLVVLLRSDCQSVLLDNATMDVRLRVVNTVLSLLGMGIWPAALYRGSPRHQCATVLNFVLIVIGWAVPIFLLARRTAASAAAQQRQQQQRQLQEQQPGEQQRRQGRPGGGLTASDRAAMWLMRSVFLEDQLPEHQASSWLCITVLSWLLAQLLATLRPG